jgi:poly-gamma-glutamate capsule biosynthesis protein CapA/YwtB (metallophosphatase superfamily)
MLQIDSGMRSKKATSPAFVRVEINVIMNLIPLGIIDAAANVAGQYVGSWRAVIFTVRPVASQIIRLEDVACNEPLL